MAPIAPGNPRHAPIGSGRPASSLRLSGLIGARNEEHPRLSGVRPGDTWTPEMHAGFAGSSQELVPKCGISFLAETGRDRSRWVEIASVSWWLRLELSRAISTWRESRLGLSRPGRCGRAKRSRAPVLEEQYCPLKTLENPLERNAVGTARHLGFGKARIGSE